MWLEILLLIIGFALLIKGADFFVDGASALADRMAVSQIVIGLTIVAFGTSAPELVVNLFAVVSGKTDISLGNIIGSNIVNILLILGIAGLIRPLQTQKNTVWREIPFALLAVLVLLVMCNDSFFDNNSNLLTRSEAIVLLLFFTIFITYSFAISKIDVRDEPEIKQLSGKMLILYLFLGIFGLIFGGQLTVSNAVKLAAQWELSDKLTGLTILAIGTSLPELVTSAVAAYKNKADIAIGNIIGSNIFNIFFILGITALVSPLPFASIMNMDLGILLLASVLLFLTMFTGKKRILDRWEAGVFIVLYVMYTGYLIIRN
ncbi:MAG: calcium/sodium antiporter [Calditrichaceae bacterium]|nr:calcium/sodium antiporter [Calditrichaceae bacterium]